MAVNEHPVALNEHISAALGLDRADDITWLSPLQSDGFAEYFDQAFLDRLGLTDLKVPLHNFWPKSGPRWDGLARTASGKVVLVEAKAHIDEAVDFKSQAVDPKSKTKINAALASAKAAFRASELANWHQPFYQYANRLAHLYYLRTLNKCDAYLLFVYFADAPDVPKPCASAQWEGAIRLTEKCLGLGAHPFRRFVGALILSVDDLATRNTATATGR